VRRRERAWSPRGGEIPPDLTAWAARVDISGVSDRTARRADRYLRTYRHLNWFARREEAARLMAVVSAEVSPAPPLMLNPLDVFATVLTMREVNHTGDGSDSRS
jgi:hypothetical protein